MGGRPTVVDDGPVRTITFNRPEVRNAIDQESADALASAVQELDDRDDLAVGIITAAGDHFCAGMDLQAFLDLGIPVAGGRGFAGLTQRPPAKPLIAAVEGYALAGGFEIALACDLIIASRTARFGLPEVRLGLVAAAGGLLRLPQRIPYHVAMQMILTGDVLAADRAERLGLISQVCEPGEALAAADALARLIAANGPLAVKASKHIAQQSATWPEDEKFERQREISDAVFASQDATEGARSFLERRKPNWRGV